MNQIPTMENFKKLVKEKNVVIYGAGEYCMRFLNRLEDDELNCIKYIVDRNTEKQKHTIYGIPVKGPESIVELNPAETLVAIALADGIPEVYDYIKNLGEYSIMPVGILISEIFSEISRTLYENSELVNQVAEMLYDETSRHIYREVIRRRMLFGECDFGDLVIGGEPEYRASVMYQNARPQNEIIIDCGAYNGDTLKKFADFYGIRLQKIYLFECMEETLRELKVSISHVENKKIHPEMVLLPYALSDHDGIMRFAKVNNNAPGSFLVDNCKFADNIIYEKEYEDVEVKTLDGVIPENERITLIKMDIEGSEYAALHGAEKMIKKYRPRLAISIYHCGEDYYRIPLYIKSLVPEYRFSVRHYKKNHCDTDLYCWLE